MTDAQQVIMLYLIAILVSQIGIISLFVRLFAWQRELSEAVYGNQDLLLELVTPGPEWEEYEDPA